MSAAATTVAGLDAGDEGAHVQIYTRDPRVFPDGAVISGILVAVEHDVTDQDGAPIPGVSAVIVGPWSATIPATTVCAVVPWTLADQK